MSAVNVVRVSRSLLCGAASIALGACGAEDGGGRANRPLADLAGCLVSEAGGGFVGDSIGQPGEVVVSSELTVQADGMPDGVIDGVIGLSPRGAASFNDLAATVRLAPGGVIDARDGAGYRADTAVPYAAGQPRRIRIVASVPTHTFSVYVATGEHDSVQLAHRYAFRPTQSTAGFLGNLDAVVDSPSGTMTVCDPRHAISIGVRMAREGNYAVAPLPAGDESIVSDGATTLHLGSSGATLAQVGAGGEVAVDPSGNVYLARITGSDLVVEAYTAGLALRWSRSFPAGAGHRVLAIGADAASVVAAAGPTAGGVDLVARWLSDGTVSTSSVGPMGDAVAIGAAGYAIGSAINRTVVVTRWSFGQATPDWQRAWQNSTARIEAMAMTPGGGVAFSGTFTGTTSFGGDPIESIGARSVYAAALSPAGDHAFSRSLPDVAVRGIASNGGVTALSLLFAPDRPELVELDAQGQRIFPVEGETGFGEAGDAGAVAVGPSGRVYWNFADAWPDPSSPAYPYLISRIPGV